MGKSKPLDPKFGGLSQRPDFSQAAQLLTPGMVYEGKVTATAANYTCTVQLDDFKLAPIDGCVWAAGILSGLVGFRTSYVPPKDTRVLVLYTGKLPVSIISCQPSLMGDVYAPSRNLLGTEESYRNAQRFQNRMSSKATMHTGHKPPLDLVEGELMIDNLMGVGLALLRGMSRLAAGDLAKIECHILDDMVRLISGKYVHHSAFGDYTISNDGGKLNVVWHGTSHEHEAWGAQRETDPKAEMAGENRIKDDPDGFLEDGRWRFSQFLGFLGNFIHVFVTDPQEQIGKIAADQFRAGKAHLHVNEDGSILMQSVADIVIEKVVAIPVPIRKVPEGDPKGNPADKPLETEPLKSWQPSDESNLFEMAFQLREYARWLNNSYALSRYYQLDKEYVVPTEAQCPAPDPNSASHDKALANAETPINWRMAYACYRIYRDGSIQHIDAYGNAYTSTAVGIQISSPKSILLQAAQDVNIVAGRDFNVLAKRNVALSACTGGLWLRANQALQMISQAGKIVIDALQTGYVKFVGALNANDTFGVDALGNVGAWGDLQVNSVAAAVTDVQLLHAGHIFHGDPKSSVTEVEDEFIYPTPENETQYDTLTQQQLKKDGTGSDWSLSDNVIDDTKGGPWPGTSQLKTTTAGASLNKPLGAKPPQGPSEGMQQTDATLKTA